MANQLLNIGANLLLRYLAAQYEDNLESQQAQQEVSEVPELCEVEPVQRIAQRDGAVISILGRPLCGKTFAAYRLAEIFNRPTYAISPQQTPPYGVKRLTLDQIDNEPPPFSTLIADDILGYMSSRDYADAFVKAMDTISQTARHERKVMLIFCMQVSGLADKYCLTGDIVILKAPSLMYADLERPAVKRFHDRAAHYWQGKPEEWLQKHCYVLSHEWEGLAWVEKPQNLR